MFGHCSKRRLCRFRSVITWSPPWFSIDTSQWSAGVDPMFAAITAALDSYEKVQSEDMCTQDKIVQSACSVSCSRRLVWNAMPG